jgi:FlaA1/EpsC-like NDP-sugar epimerase
VKGVGRYRRYIAPVYDVFVAALSLPLAVGLRVGFDDLPTYAPQLVYTVPAFCGIAAVCFYQSRMYRGLWQYSSLGDLQAIGRGVLAAVLVFVALMFAVDRMHGLPRTVPVIQTLVLLAILGASRFTRRVLRERSAARMQKPDNTERWLIPILLVGAEYSATMLIRRLASGHSIEPFRVVGILDFDNENVGRTVMGVPILGTIDMFEAVLKRLGRGQRPQKVVLTRTISEQRMCELRTLADKAQISLVRPRSVDFEKIAEDGKIEFRPIVFENLLRRPTVALNQQAIERMIEGRRIVITGAGGSVGSELSHQIAQRRPGELVLLDVSEFNLYTIDREIGELSPSVARRSVLLDIRDRASIEHLFDTCRPEIVFHAAALKHVTLVESNPIEGVRTNAFGTRNVADAARRCGAETFIQISTDKAVRPTCVMGATKRLAEFYCQALDRARRPNGNPTPATRFVIVRFGNVLGSRGSVIPLFEKQLQRGGPLTVTDPNVTRFFMSIREAVELVLQASGSGTPAGDVTGLVHVLDMGEPVRIFEVAEHMIRLAGFRPQDEVRIEFTGLRQGEKLHEELFDPAEKAVENGIAGVFVVRSKVPELSTLTMAFSRLEYACAAQDEAAVKRQLKCIVLPQIGDARTVEGAFN